MRISSALTLLAVGAILLFAVNIRLSFIDLHVAGLVLAATGAAGLSLALRQPGWLQRRLGALRYLLDADASSPDGTRAPLTDLLGDPAGAVFEPAAAGQAGAGEAATLPDGWAASGVTATG